MTGLLADFEYSYNSLFDAVLEDKVDIDKAEEGRELSLALLDCWLWPVVEELLARHESDPLLDIRCQADILHKNDRKRGAFQAIEAILPIVDYSLPAARQYLLYRWLSEEPSAHADQLCRALIDAQEINAFAHIAMYMSLTDMEMATELAQSLEDVASIDHTEMRMMLRFQLWHGSYESREYWANRALRSYPKSELLRANVMKLDRIMRVRRGFSLKEDLETFRYNAIQINSLSVFRPLSFPRAVLAGIVSLRSSIRLTMKLG